MTKTLLNYIVTDLLGTSSSESWPCPFCGEPDSLFLKEPTPKGKERWGCLTSNCDPGWGDAFDLLRKLFPGDIADARRARLRRYKRDHEAGVELVFTVNHAIATPSPSRNWEQGSGSSPEEFWNRWFAQKGEGVPDEVFARRLVQAIDILDLMAAINAVSPEVADYFRVQGKRFFQLSEMVFGK